MKFLKLVILFLAPVLGASAQEYELGEVTKAELEEKQHPKDANAPAAILYTKGTSFMYFSENTGFTLITEVEAKIKIYTKEGYEWANKVIPFYNSDSDKEKVDVSKAITYNLVDGDIKKTKLKSDGEFTEQANKYWKKKKIIMPDVKEGSIIEYKYTITSPFTHVLPEWHFQEVIPVNYSQYTTKLPEYYTFMPRFRGTQIPVVTRNQTTKSLSFTSKERRGNRPTVISTDKVSYIEHATTYTIVDVPALKYEGYTNNIENYISGIEHEMSMIKYPNEPIKTLSTNWDDVARSIYKYDGFGSELNKSGYYEDDVKALLAGLNTAEEKLNALFSYVRGRMTWNEYTGYTCNDGVKKAYKDKVGNVAEINLMLVSMLRYAGLEANPVLVSTRSNKVALYPSTSAFNYVIAGVDINDKRILLDATSKSAMPDILPVRAINWMGRLIKADGTSQNVELMPKTISKETITIQAQLAADGKITGKARDIYFDYNAFGYRENYTGVNADSYVEMLEKRYNGLEVGNYKVTNDKEYTKPVVEDYDFTHSSVTDIIGDNIYINPMLFFTRSENPFKQEKREYPIDFIYPHQDKYLITIAIPQGYVVESVPGSLAVGMEDNLGSFKYQVAQAGGNNLQIAAVLDINEPLVPADYYATLKDFFQKVVEKQAEKIVLKKQ